MSLRLRGMGSFLVVSTALVISGCTGGATPPPEIGTTAPVTGTVTLDGKALADANVVFHPEGTAGFQGASGATDAQGKYELKMQIGRDQTKTGVVPGKYKVTVSRWGLPDGSPMPKGESDPQKVMMMGAKETAPMKTAHANTTDLTYDVPSAGGAFDIELKSEATP